MQDTEKARIRVIAQQDGWCRARGGFLLASMPDGSYDYFYSGMQPQAEELKSARIVERWTYDPTTDGWRQLADVE